MFSITGIPEDNTALKQHWAELQSLQMRYVELEAERNALQDALADALNQLQDTRSSNIEVLSLRKQNKQLEEDVLLLKSTVYRFAISVYIKCKKVGLLLSC